ncbi:MAG: hypothetical protein H7256_13840, partial [Bdellovibrio sp.]|nr:hypothetical protein [Bdellovibrio sp.]
RITLRTLGLPGITAEQTAEAIRAANESITAFEEAEKRYTGHGFTAGQKDLYEKVHADWVAFKDVGTHVFALQKVGTPESMQQIVKIFFGACPAAAAKVNTSMTDLLTFHKKTAKTKKDLANAIADQVNLFIILVAAVGILVGLVVGFFFATSVSKAILKVSNHLAENAELVSSASTEIASSSGSLSASATQQAASLEETAASLEQITAMISKAAENAKLAAQSSANSHSKAEEGRAAVDEVMHSMDDISESNVAIMNQVNESNLQMFEIVKVIQEIGNKTKVINDIVFQTKLLSFNASVEAARAGEHGKGFAVVAEEVGKLAQMSGNAAKEISDMLDSSISKVENLVSDSKTKVESLVDLGKRKVDAGVNVAKKCSDVLNEIVRNVSEVSSLAQEISQATAEQAQGVGEINRAIGQLDTVTQSNTTSSAEAASAATSLSSQAESLKHSVDELSYTIQGRPA